MPALSDILGKAYDAIVLKRGEEEDVIKEFRKAYEESDSFAAAVEVRKRGLESFETYVLAAGVPHAARDFVGALQLAFMRRALSDTG